MKATEGNMFGENAATRISDMVLFQEPETYSVSLKTLAFIKNMKKAIVKSVTLT